MMPPPELALQTMLALEFIALQYDLRMGLKSKLQQEEPWGFTRAVIDNIGLPPGLRTTFGSQAMNEYKSLFEANICTTGDYARVRDKLEHLEAGWGGV